MFAARTKRWQSKVPFHEGLLWPAAAQAAGAGLKEAPSFMEGRAYKEEPKGRPAFFAPSL
jgi:hypothetical protein